MRPESHESHGRDTPENRDVIDYQEASIWQYRSEIFPHDESQYQKAVTSVENKKAATETPIYTSVSPLVDEIDSTPDRWMCLGTDPAPDAWPP